MEATYSNQCHWLTLMETTATVLHHSETGTAGNGQHPSHELWDFRKCNKQTFQDLWEYLLLQYQPMRRGDKKCGCALYFSALRCNGLFFPFPTNALMVSQPVKAWNAGSAAETSLPRTDDTLFILIKCLLFPSTSVNKQQLSGYCTTVVHEQNENVCVG